MKHTPKDGKQRVAGSQWQDRWWLRSPLAEIAAGRSRSKHGAEFWYQHYWKPRELSAWLYELVRRLPNTRRPIPEPVRRQLLRMPPYPNLSFHQRNMLFIIVSRELNPSSLSQTKVVLGESRLPAWKQGQAAKLGNWSHVEAMGKPVNSSTMDDRRYGRENAIRFLPLIISAWRLMSLGPAQQAKFLQAVPDPERQEFSGARISLPEFRAALAEAVKKVTTETRSAS